VARQEQGGLGVVLQQRGKGAMPYSLFFSPSRHTQREGVAARVVLVAILRFAGGGLVVEERSTSGGA